jgi:diguanylate cyclase (GGDEF)-like protein
MLVGSIAASGWPRSALRIEFTLPASGTRSIHRHEALSGRTSMGRAGTGEHVIFYYKPRVRSLVWPVKNLRSRRHTDLVRPGPAPGHGRRPPTPRFRQAGVLRLGVAGGLAFSLLAVAVLAIAANLLAGGKLSVLRVTEVRRERPPATVVVAPSPAPSAEVVARTVAPGPVPVPFPSSDALFRALDRIEGAVDAGIDADPAEISARYQKSITELDHAAAEFAANARKAGESPPSRFVPTVKSYEQHGGELIKLTASRRESMQQYSSHFEQLNARVKKSLDHAWNIFGRVVARQSLVKLTGDLDELRRRYAEISSAEAVDPSTFDALKESEVTLAQTLTQDRGGLTRSDGKDWYTQSQEDLLAMSAARKSLLQIDRQRKEGARRFGDDFAALSQIVGAMGKTETYDARLTPSANTAPMLISARAGRMSARSGGALTPVPTSTGAIGTSTNAITDTATAGEQAPPMLAARQSASAGQRQAVTSAANAGRFGAAPEAMASLQPSATYVTSGVSLTTGMTGTGGSAGTVGIAGTSDRAGAPVSSAAIDGGPRPDGVVAAADATQDLTSPSGPRVGVVSRDPATTTEATIQRSDSTTTLETPDDSRHVLLFWLSTAVLLAVACVSAFILIGILRPVRRLVSASSRIANGETGISIPRGGLRELDTLAEAFNNMAAQLAAAQEVARLQQESLEEKVAERTAELQQLAQLDPLTRLANRRHFFTLLNAAIENASRENRLVGVFFVDVDNFKHINDGLGHEYGDQLLQTIAQRLSDSTHSFGFAARLGGDEFTVVYESASSIEDIRIAGLQLVEAFEEPLPLEGRELVLSVSAGASVYPEHAADVEGLLRSADAALYQAKTHGRGQLALFTPTLLETASARFTIEQGLRRAIERGEFELVFQPEVNLQTGETELVEALLRWRLPDGSYASPGDFLSIAEASGLIFQLNDWVLRRALETLAEWHHGLWPAARIAINISSRQLFDHSFVDRVQNLLAEYRLPPSCIEIELTEQVLQTGQATIAALRRLHEHGIAIALDDFGSGYSSLASLEQLPLTRIKLDSSLVASIDTSPRSASIARAIILLCQDLGLAITAEGIERLEQLAPLIGYANLYAQGFLLAPPQSAEEVLRAMQTLPALTRALVGSSVARLPEPQLAERLPIVVADTGN